MLVEQTTPSGLATTDKDSLTCNVTFPDQDFEDGDVGGVLSRSSPIIVIQVEYYEVQWSSEPDGTNRSYFAI